MLQLCESDWKVDQIATDNYPSWYSSWHKKLPEATIKEERDSIPPDSNISKCPNNSVTTAELDSKERKVKCAKNNSEELKNTNQVLNSSESIPHFESRLGLNLPVWNSDCVYYNTAISMANSSTTHYLLCQFLWIHSANPQLRQLH